MAGQYATFYLPDWIHAVANVLESEVSDIRVLYTYSGSIYVDFEMENPNPDSITHESTQIRRLSGNEKILLLYQWWLTNNPRLADFPWDIENMKLYGQRVDASSYGEVVELFAQSSLSPIFFGPRPNDDDDDSNSSIISGFYFDQTTFQLDLTVNNLNENSAPSTRMICWSLFVVVLLAALFY
jgi:hypothetical protein